MDLAGMISSEDQQTLEETQITFAQALLPVQDLERHVQVSVAKVLYPRYRGTTERLNSYSAWPSQMVQRPEDLVEAGFFYTGHGDCTTCYQCGLEVSQWETEDTPWGEHLRWMKRFNTRCQYMDFIKGKSFYDDYTESTTPLPEESDLQDNEHSSSSNVRPQTSESDPACVICLTKKLDVLFLPCAHIATCKECGLQLDKCPICRRALNAVMVVYIVN